MRRARITYPGAYHHVMNRGYGEMAIFPGNESKNDFLNYLEDAVTKMKIRVFAYCIMDNHYHLVLENTTGRMSDFLKLLNGNYGMCYRKRFGGKGYVFQNRYKSTIIENDAYLIQSIVYTLQNPVRADIVSHATLYTWSSASNYFSGKTSKILDSQYVEELFVSKEALFTSCNSLEIKGLPTNMTEYGEVFGSDKFLGHAFKRFDRRIIPTEQSPGYQRKDERYFEPVEKVIQEFQESHQIDIYHIKINTSQGKRLRSELLVQLKERAGWKYKEIAELEIFQDLSFESLRAIYRNEKKRMSEKTR